jgi:hypothetical protein
LSICSCIPGQRGDKGYEITFSYDLEETNVVASKKGLLLHWWHYYGKMIYTLDELEQFEGIIDKYGEDNVLEAAVLSYIMNDGSPSVILISIQQGNVEELFNTLPDISKLEQRLQDSYRQDEEIFLKQISTTFR